MTDYRTVPVDPTEEMLHAADMKAMFTRGESDMPRALWSAMLAAAPALSASPAPAGDLVERVAKLLVDMTGVGTLGLTYEASITEARRLASAVIAALQQKPSFVERISEAVNTTHDILASAQQKEG